MNANKLLFVLLVSIPVFAGAQHVVTTDVKNFWITKDSLTATSDTAKQAEFIRRLYFDKASEGLQAFMRNKDNLSRRYAEVMTTNPAFWDSLRVRASHLGKTAKKLEVYISRFKKLYPGLKPATTYFLVGLRQQGGTIRGNLSILGIEVVLGAGNIDDRQLTRMGIHEYVHTQQKRPDFQKIDVLTSSVREGACDFMARLVTGTSPSAAYMEYGNTHEAAVWQLFEKEMFTMQNDNWVSTGKNPALLAPDLGYFIGYQICKAYYNQVKDKQQAIREIIELDYADEKAVADFFKRSGYRGAKS